MAELWQSPLRALFAEEKALPHLHRNRPHCQLQSSPAFYTTELLHSTIVIIQPVTIWSGNASPHQFRDLVPF
jgi:hypothetical protein